MKLFRVALSLLAAAALVLPIAIAEGQAAPPDVSGAWTLELTATLPEDEVPCVFQGTVIVTQAGDQVTGPADLTLASGPAECPTEMTGTLTGTAFFGNLGEPAIDGVIDGGALGAADVSGTFITGTVAAAGLLAAALPMQEPMSGGGTMSVTTGPFAGTGGIWAAAVAPAVPTLAPLALTALVLLLLATGFFVLRRQELHRAA